MKRLLWVIQIFFILVLSAPFALLPLRWALKAGEYLGLFIFHIWGGRRKIAIENMRKSVDAGAIRLEGTPELAIKENFKNMGRSLVEVIKIYYGLGRKIIDSVVVEGIEHAIKANSKGKGIMLITGHCGNWEIMALAGSAKFKGFSVLARPLNNKFINRFVEITRKRYGNNIIYKEGALRDILNTFRTGGTVGILMDQSVLAVEGYIIDFLGRGAWTTKMPALIARKYEAAVVPVFIHRQGNGHKIIIYPEIELSHSENKEQAVIEDTKKFSGYIENYIKEHPTEWLWIHRKWKRV
ncbi:MAG: lysophospholipid acyltransferase family protein [Nitrospiraceae bacterium]|nr:lysophospholipid acyltransferase family protein [Nitrospiraceae bacterium]